MKIPTPNRAQAKDILANIVIFFLFITPVISVRIIITQEMPWLHGFLIIPLMALLWVRKYVFNMRAFFVIHGIILLLPLATLFSPSLYIPLQAFAAACVIYSVRARPHGEWHPENRHAVHMVLAFALFFIVLDVMLGVAVEALRQFFFGVTLTAVAANLLVAHMQNIDERIEMLPNYLKESTTQSNILSANNRLISGFLSAMMGFGALALLSNNIWRLIMLAARGFGYLAMFFFGIPAVIMARLVQDVDTPYGDITEDMVVVYEVGEALQPEIFTDTFYVDEGMAWRWFLIMSILFIAPVVCMLFIFARAALRKLIRNFFNRNDQDEGESLMPDDAMGRLSFLFNDLAALLPRLSPDNRHPIRRAYNKKINRHIKKGAPITQSDTPQTIATKINPTEDITDLTAKYEQVRYGR